MRSRVRVHVEERERPKRVEEEGKELKEEGLRAISDASLGLNVPKYDVTLSRVDDEGKGMGKEKVSLDRIEKEAKKQTTEKEEELKEGEVESEEEGDAGDPVQWFGVSALQPLVASQRAFVRALECVATIAAAQLEIAALVERLTVTRRG